MKTLDKYERKLNEYFGVESEWYFSAQNPSKILPLNEEVAATKRSFLWEISSQMKLTTLLAENIQNFKNISLESINFWDKKAKFNNIKKVLKNSHTHTHFLASKKN